MSARKYNASLKRIAARAALGTGELVCRICGASVAMKKATHHAWEVHKKAVPIDELNRHFVAARAA